MTMMLFRNVASRNASDSWELWPSSRRRMGAVFTLWLLANGMKVSMNQAVLISLSVQPLGDIAIAEIVLDRVGNEGTHPLERTNKGGTDNLDGEMHSMMVVSSRLSEQMR